jgi:hypothetical protein
MIETVRRCVCDWCLSAGPAALESEDPAELARAEGWHVVTVTDDANEEGAVCPNCTNAGLVNH